jgi:hypothetical protein
MPFDESKFQRAQARYDEMEPPEDEMPSDEDIFGLLWEEDVPETHQEAVAAVRAVRGGMAAIVLP